MQQQGIEMKQVRVMIKKQTHQGVVTPERPSEYVVLIADDNSSIEIIRESTSPGVLIPGTKFQVGDAAEYDSFNLSYVGVIERITDKTVTIVKTRGTNSTKHRLSLYEFCWRNHKFDAAETQERNRIESMNI
jgi:hypothetical protein